MTQMGRTGGLATNKLTSEYAAITQRVGELNNQLSDISAFAKTKRSTVDLAASYETAKLKANELHQSLAQAKQFATQSQSALTAYRKELDGQTGKATDAQKLKLKLLGDQARAAQSDITRLTSEFKWAGASVKKLDTQLQESRLSLQTQRAELLKNGVSTSQLGSHKSALISKLAQEQSRIDSLSKSYDAYSRKQRQIGKANIQQTELRNQGASMHGEAIGALGTAWAVVNPLKAAVQASSAYRVELTRIGNTSEMTREQSISMGNELLKKSVEFGVSADKLKGGLGEMVAGGIDPTTAMKTTGTMANVIKAYNADATEVGSTNNSLITSMGYAAEGLKRPWDILATSAAQGNFELKDLAKWLPSLGASVKALGSTGDVGTATSAAFLQIAKRGAGSADEAANNYQNFLQKLSSGTTEKNAQDMGFSIRDTMLKAKKEGLDPVEAAVAKIKDMTGGDQFKLAELFPDQQAQNFLRPAIQNWADYKKIKDGSLNGDGKVDKDAQKIAEESAAISEKAGAAWLHFKVAIGDALTPVWNKVVTGFTSFITVATNWVTEYPRVVAGIFTIISAFTAFRVGAFATRVAMLGWKLGVIGLRIKGLSLVGMVHRITGSIQALRLGLNFSGRALIRKNNLLGTLARSFSHVSRFAGSAVGAIKKFAGTKLGKGVGKGLGAAAGAYGLYDIYKKDKNAGAKNQTTGQKVASYAQGAMSGAAIGMMFGPIGAAVGAALGLVYTAVVRNWDKIKITTMTKLSELKASTIAKFDEISAWFSGLPARFTSYGSDIIQGLLNGITSKYDAVVGKIKSLGTAISNAFTSNPKIEVRSPSRAFKRYGGFITEGLGIGIDKGAVRPLKAIGAFASNLQQRFKNRAGELSTSLSARMQNNAAELAQAHAQQAQSSTGAGSYVIHYSPQISAPNGNVEQIKDALRLSQREFEAMFERMVAGQARRAY